MRSPSPRPFAAPLDASNPYNAGPVSGLAFNNLACALLPPPAAPGAAPAPDAASAPGAPPEPSLLEVSYAPVQYLGQTDPVVSTRTQFLAR